MMRQRFVATCTRGAEEVLAAELTSLGIGETDVDRGAVRFTGQLSHGYRACLWSRIASRVLLVLDRVQAPHADALYDGVARLDWRNHLPPQRTFRVDFVGTSDALRNTRFGAQVTKDAVLSSFGGRAPRVDTRRPDLRIHVHLRQDWAQLALDLTGEALHLRTPGRKGGDAPLRENLAATLLHIADWPLKSREGATLVDPMCGSGTFLSEAAGIVLDRAPGLGRKHWGFLGWAGHDGAAWQAELRQARERGREGAQRQVRVRGSDRSAEQVKRARYNLGVSGLEDVVLAVRSLSDQHPPEGEEGIVVVNPPFGERLGDEHDLAPLYRELGDVLRRRFLGWTGWILASDRNLAGSIGLRPARRVPIHNGPLECRWLSFPIRKEKVARDR